MRRKQRVEFYKHNLSSKDKKECLNVLDSLFLTTGKKVKEFEQKFSSFLNAKYAVGLTSCTDALFLSVKYFIKEGDEVITTPLSFIATANVIEYCGAKPVFADVERLTGNINVDGIEKLISNKTKAILVVHLYGQMCDMKKIAIIANKYNLKIIEDCAHCIEGERDGLKVGEISDAACFSFYATKNITSGEGGAITCNNKRFYEWLLKARQHGMNKNAIERYSKIYKHWDMDILGYKCNMSNIQASLLINQLNNINSFLRKKENIAKKYNDGFRNNKHIDKPAVLPKSKHARHLYTIWVDSNKRDKIMHKLQKAEIGVAVNFRPIHLMSYYRKKYLYKIGDYPIAEKIGSSTISIPFYPKLTQQEISYVISTINSLTTE